MDQKASSVEEANKKRKRNPNGGTALSGADDAITEQRRRPWERDDANGDGDNRSDSNDQGHRYGNFHNYYAFNSVENRSQLLGGMIDYMAFHWFNNGTNVSHNSSEKKLQYDDLNKGVFYYTDIGCNEGNLTMKVAEMLSERLLKQLLSCDKAHPFYLNDTKNTQSRKANSATSPLMVQVTGLDLDPVLVQRAQQKRRDNNILTSMMQFNFRQVDVLQEGVLESPDDSQIESSKNATSNIGTTTADLTTVFSTTMWIHVHGGDDGLRRVLSQICASTRHFLLMEAQPSKCYGNVATRLRRMGREPIDVSNDRLKLRSNIEEAVEVILKEGGFKRVLVGTGQVTTSLISSDPTNGDKEDEEVSRCGTTDKHPQTLWNRKLRLYQRVTSTQSSTT